MANLNKKCLIIDSSGVRPFVFAVKNLSLNFKKFEEFSDHFDIFIGDSLLLNGEFSFSYGNQQSIFTSPINPVQLTNFPLQNFSIVLSDAGYLSQTINKKSKFSFNISKIEVDVNQRRILWDSSPHWDFLSDRDKDIISLAYQKNKTYDEVAVLTNDWHLRQQCLEFEGISTYGSCSMLAGAVLTGFITYQQGTYIYSGWLKEEPKWIPYAKNEYGFKRKLKFREVLEIERWRIKNNESFWIS